jgi:hypothetical protein
MSLEIAEALSLDERVTLTLEQLVEMSELPAEGLRARHYGALARWIRRRRAGVHGILGRRRKDRRRLRRDFELDAHSLSVVLRYVQRVEALEGSCAHCTRGWASAIGIRSTRVLRPALRTLSVRLRAAWQDPLGLGCGSCCGGVA